MFDHPTIDALAAFLETQLGLAAPETRATTDQVTQDVPAADAPSMNASDVAAMSDEEIERLLLERMENDR
jgi:hypothetical protein